MKGILLIDKPRGPTSQKVVRKIKGMLQLKRAGHTGTLDPLATGVLPVALGAGTKLIPFLEESQKIYQVTARLGVITDTLDAEGEILETRFVPEIRKEQLVHGTRRFTGVLFQIPPLYSAVKISGRPLYRYARKQQSVEIPPRQVRIDRIELLHWNLPELELRIHCSRGTYIRSLIHDLGLELGCGAHVIKLRRLRSGPFSVECAVPLQDVLERRSWKPEAFYSPLEVLSHLPAVTLNDTGEIRRIGQGLRFYGLRERLKGKGLEEGRVLLKSPERALAVLDLEKSGNFRFLRVFS